MGEAYHVWNSPYLRVLRGYYKISILEWDSKSLGILTNLSRIEGLWDDCDWKSDLREEQEEGMNDRA